MPLTHQVDELCARVAVLLPGLAGAKIQGLSQQEDLLRVVYRQTDLG